MAGDLKATKSAPTRKISEVAAVKSLGTVWLLSKSTLFILKEQHDSSILRYIVITSLKTNHGGPKKSNSFY